jgi:hypothetical protein
MTMFTAASVGSSFVYFHRFDAAAGPHRTYAEGTGDLVSRAATVVAVRDGLLKAHPILPPRSRLLLKSGFWGIRPRFRSTSVVRGSDSRDLSPR